MPDTTDPQNAEPIRIPIGRNITYAVSGMPNVPNAYGPGVLVPAEVSLTYRAAEDSRRGRLHAYVSGRLWVDGAEVPLLSGGLYGQHYDDGPDGWPAWLAEEARLHDPAASSAAVSPPPATDRAGLREQVAEVLRPHASLGGTPPRYELPFFDGATPSLPRISGWRPLDDVADAVLSVLPPDGRAAGLLEGAAAVAADTEIHIRYGSATDYANRHADLLRRLAAGERDEQQTQQECALCGHRTCMLGKPCGVIATERGDLAERCGCTGGEAPQPETQAPVKPTSHAWTFEVCYEGDKWHGCGATYDDSVFDNAHETAQDDFQHRAENDKQRRRFRMIRATTTYAIEAEHQPAAAPVAGQPPADTGEAAQS